MNFSLGVWAAGKTKKKQKEKRRKSATERFLLECQLQSSLKYQKYVISAAQRSK